MSDKTIVITGASGVVGIHLAALALSRGWTVRTLTRGRSERDPKGLEKVSWDPAAAASGDPAAIAAIAGALEGAQIIVNLAGAGVADKRLTEAWKREVMNSRLDSARALVKAWAACKRPPGFWVQASAVGFYGDTGDALVDESTGPGDDYLAGVCVAWEEAGREIFAVEGARDKVRQVIARIGLVFATDSKPWMGMTTPIRFGAGGPIGSGQQFYPWIDADDLARAVFFLYEKEGAEGIYNFTGPDPVRQRDLVRKIASKLRRPAFLPVPAFALRIAIGDMAEALLASNNAPPRRLLDAGFTFDRANIDQEIEALLADS